MLFEGLLFISNISTEDAFCASKYKESVEGMSRTNKLQLHHGFGSIHYLSYLGNIFLF
jgi:hypothetical protein